MKFSSAQRDAGDRRHRQRVFDESLTLFESDTRPVDQKLADDIKAYRIAGRFDVFQGITQLTNIGNCQRALLAMALQSGIDFTTDDSFRYIITNPALSGNTKARHIILMAVAMQQNDGQVT